MKTFVRVIVCLVLAVGALIVMPKQASAQVATVYEGNSGSYFLRPFNPNAPGSGFTFLPTQITYAIKFSGGECDDEAYGPYTLSENLLFKPLGPGQRGQIEVGFKSKDDHPDNDLDFGDWTITTTVQYTVFQNGTYVSTNIRSHDDIVRVTDAPEPSSLLLFGAGVLVPFGYIWRHRRKVA